MNDSLFFGVLAYLFISASIAGFLPDDFYSGTRHNELQSDEFREIALQNVEDVSGLLATPTFFQKILTFLFVTWTIEGIPALIALMILFVNIVSILIVSIWTYDKLRGVS